MKRILLLYVLFSFLSLESAHQEDDDCSRLFLNCLSAQAIGCGWWMCQRGFELSTQAHSEIVVRQAGYKLLNNLGIVINNTTLVKVGISPSALANIGGYSCCIAGCCLCCLVQGARLCDQEQNGVIRRQPR